MQAAVLGYWVLVKDILHGTRAANIMYPNSVWDKEYFYAQTEQLHPHYLQVQFDHHRKIASELPILIPSLDNSPVFFRCWLSKLAN